MHECDPVKVRFKVICSYLVLTSILDIPIMSGRLITGVNRTLNSMKYDHK